MAVIVKYEVLNVCGLGLVRFGGKIAWLVLSLMTCFGSGSDREFCVWIWTNIFDPINTLNQVYFRLHNCLIQLEAGWPGLHKLSLFVSCISPIV